MTYFKYETDSLDNIKFLNLRKGSIMFQKRLTSNFNGWVLTFGVDEKNVEPLLTWMRKMGYIDKEAV